MLSKPVLPSVIRTYRLANAGRHSAVSYKRAGEMIAEAEAEAGKLIVKAEEAGRIVCLMGGRAGLSKIKTETR
jgi:molybdenum-dependent DNA-binding transcriptional regulator ModE